MLRMARILWTGIIFSTVLASSGRLCAQELVREALSSFPSNTIRMEYSHPTVLRALPNYSALRQKYEGPRLQELENSFSQMGIQESDVDELVLGWRIVEQQWDFYGLTSGRFDAKAMAARAASQGLAPVAVADLKAYCLGSGSAAKCMVLLENSLGAFGSLNSLQSMLEARSGKAPGIGSDNNFVKLVNQAGTKTPIWGAASGPAVSDWFRGWLPNQANLKLDWAQVFKSVEALTYSIDPGSTVRLSARMTCTTPEAASGLRQAFDGLKLFQQLTWQNQHASLPNPYENLNIEASGTQVLIDLKTPYSALEAGGTAGTR